MLSCSVPFLPLQVELSPLQVLPVVLCFLEACLRSYALWVIKLFMFFYYSDLYIYDCIGSILKNVLLRDEPMQLTSR